MDIGILVSIALAVASPLAVIAYKHPKPFARLYFWLWGIGLVAMLCVGSREAGLNTASRAMRPFLASAKVDEADVALDTHRMPGWVIPAFWGWWAYLSILLALPYLGIVATQSERSS